MRWCLIVALTLAPPASSSTELDEAGCALQVANLDSEKGGKGQTALLQKEEATTEDLKEEGWPSPFGSRVRGSESEISHSPKAKSSSVSIDAHNKPKAKYLLQAEEDSLSEDLRPDLLHKPKAKDRLHKPKAHLLAEEATTEDLEEEGWPSPFGSHVRGSESEISHSPKDQYSSEPHRRPKALLQADLRPDRTSQEDVVAAISKSAQRTTIEVTSAPSETDHVEVPGLGKVISSEGCTDAHAATDDVVTLLVDGTPAVGDHVEVPGCIPKADGKFFHVSSAMLSLLQVPNPKKEYNLCGYYAYGRGWLQSA